jgi:hypothetical protein
MEETLDPEAVLTAVISEAGLVAGDETLAADPTSVQDPDQEQ